MREDKNCLVCGAPLDLKLNRSIGEYGIITDKKDLWFLLKRVRSLELTEKQKAKFERIEKRYIAKIKKYLKKLEAERQRQPPQKNKDSKEGSSLIKKFLKEQEKKKQPPPLKREKQSQIRTEIIRE